MGNIFQRRRLHSLIVSMAILLNLFAPAIGQTVAARSPESVLLELCSATTAPASFSSSSSSSSSPSRQKAHTATHCAFCATHLDTYAPPPATAGLLAVLHGHDTYPSLHAATPAPRPTWSSAQPRAPPAFS